MGNTVNALLLVSLGIFVLYVLNTNPSSVTVPQFKNKFIYDVIRRKLFPHNTEQPVEEIKDRKGTPVVLDYRRSEHRTVYNFKTSILSGVGQLEDTDRKSKAADLISNSNTTHVLIDPIPIHVTPGRMYRRVVTAAALEGLTDNNGISLAQYLVEGPVTDQSSGIGKMINALPNIYGGNITARALYPGFANISQEDPIFFNESELYNVDMQMMYGRKLVLFVNVPPRDSINSERNINFLNKMHMRFIARSKPDHPENFNSLFSIVAFPTSEFTPMPTSEREEIDRRLKSIKLMKARSKSKWNINQGDVIRSGKLRESTTISEAEIEKQHISPRALEIEREKKTLEYFRLVKKARFDILGNVFVNPPSQSSAKTAASGEDINSKQHLIFKRLMRVLAPTRVQNIISNTKHGHNSQSCDAFNFTRITGDFWKFLVLNGVPLKYYDDAVPLYIVEREVRGVLGIVEGVNRTYANVKV